MTLRTNSLHGVALQLRIMYACIRWSDLEPDDDKDEVHTYITLYTYTYITLYIQCVTKLWTLPPPKKKNGRLAYFIQSN